MESKAAVGRRGGAFFNQAAGSLQTTGARLGQSVREAGDAAVDYMDHQQINAGAEHGANLFANLTDSWNQTAAGSDPHDPSVAKKWREEQLEPALQQFQQGFGTEKSQAWAEHFVDQTRTHMFAKTEADMSSLAAAAVSSTVKTLANKFGNTAVSDPSAVPAMLDQVDHSIDGIIGANPNLKGADAARVRMEVGEKVKEQIVKSGAIGAMQKGGDPDAIAAQWTQKYPQYINGPEAIQLAKSAIYYNRLNTSEARADRVQRDYLAKQDFNGQIDQLEAATMPKNVGDLPQLPKDYWDKMRQLSTHPGAALEPGRLKTMVDVGESVTARLAKRDPPQTDPEIYAGLKDRLFDPNNPTKLTDILKVQDRLNDTDRKQLLESVKLLQAEPLQDPVFKETMKGAQQLIEGRTPGEKMMQSGKYASFVRTFLPQYLSLHNAGTLPPNALDMNDPKSLISQSMEAYKSPLAKAISGNGGVGSGVTPTPSATPGVSATPPVELPPVRERVKDKMYPTARGMMIWTGTGWRRPDASM